MSKITDAWWNGRVMQIPRNLGNHRPDLIILDDMEENMAEPIYGIDWATNHQFNVKKFHQVKIDKVDNGFIIEIGCKKFVDTDWDKLAKKLGEYWKDPAAAEKKYCK